MQLIILMMIIITILDIRFHELFLLRSEPFKCTHIVKLLINSVHQTVIHLTNLLIKITLCTNLNICYIY